MVNLRRLYYFISVVEHGSVTKASQILHIAQPPLSQQLRLLEEEMKVKLFYRQGRTLHLTPAGEALYNRVKPWVQDLDDIVQFVRDVEHGVSGTLSIGFAKTYFASLSTLFQTFHQSYPHIRFQLREGDTSRIESMLENREIELGMVRLPVENSEWHVIPLPSDPYVVVTPESWGMPPMISIEALDRRPLLLLHRVSGRGQFELIMEAFRKRHLEPYVLIESPDVHILLTLVAEGLGATIVPRPAAQRWLPQNTRLSTLLEKDITTQPGVIYDKHRPLSKAAARFLDLIVHTMRIKHP
ncbi:MAG: LysR family transcriptional regulator [Candidatus Carbobacillus sp.]|nr:LysR family transcriptional regulator [Candidatus Carbobacillus sp.]